MDEDTDRQEPEWPFFEAAPLRRTIGSESWISSLTDEQIAIVRDEIIPVWHKKFPRPGKHVLIPDELGDRDLDILSGLDKLIMYVTNKIQNAFVYTRLRTDSSRFQAEFIVMATVAGKTYTATYLTPGYAIGMTDEMIPREGDTVVSGLVRNLGQRAFGEPTPHIPDGALMSFEYTEKW